MDVAESWLAICKTNPALDLLKNENFAHFEDHDNDVYFAGYEVLQHEKRLIDML